ncbi:phosphonate degradation HD-domain oxygenase [Chitinibacteraceae bacterium HSL-7]
MSRFDDVSLASLRLAFEHDGNALYGGEGVSQLEHALQSARAAERDGASPALIVAALLHDVGHLLAGQQDDDLANGIDDHHEGVGARALATLFGPEVTQPIALHVLAKRYLCTTDPGYHATLSDASRCSLALQGGEMTAAEVSAFERRPFGADAIRLRHFDDLAKVVGLSTPPLDHYLAIASTLIRR